MLQRLTIPILVSLVISFCGGDNDPKPAAHAAPSLQVAPLSALIDEPVTIRLTGFPAEQEVTLRLTTPADSRSNWESSAVFKVDGEGSLDLARTAPLSGSYEGVDAMGLFWSLQRPHDGIAGLIKSDLATVTYTLTAEANGQAVASATLERTIVGPQVKRTTVDENGLKGALFTPASGNRRPAVIVVGGSEGGNGFSVPVAALLASYDFVTLALPYFNYQGLPPNLVDIPLEYFEHAIAWLGARPEVSSDRVAVLGVSRGGELSLLLGSKFPNVAAVVAYVPSNVVNGGLSRTQVGGGLAAWTSKGTPIRPSQAIEVEKTNGPILLISGGDDKLWPSELASVFVMARLKERGFAHEAQHLTYKTAGHAAGFPYTPTTVGLGDGVHPVTGRPVSLGGTASGNAQLKAESWPKVIRFLKANLK